MRFLLIVALLAGMAGCKSEDRVTEGDRKLSKQNEGAAKVIVKAVDKAEAVPGVPAAALDALGPVRPAANDIVKNSEQQLKGWGQPKDAKPYSAAESEIARKESEEEHQSGSVWPYIVSAAGIGAGMFIRSAGFGGIPIVGKILARIAPRFAAGAGKADDMNLGYQEVLAKSRKEIDKWGDRARAKLAEKGIPESIIAMIPTGEIIVDKITKVMTRKGLIVENDLLYEKAREKERKGSIGVLDVSKLSDPPQVPAASPPDTKPPADKGAAS